MRNRTSYLCGNCNKTFQDLEVNQLLDISTGQLRCTYCSNELEESVDTECSTQLISMARCVRACVCVYACACVRACVCNFKLLSRHHIIN